MNWNWWERFEGLFKREIPEDRAEFNAMFARLDVDGFFNQLNNLWAPGQLIRKLGGYQNFDILYKDQDIYAAVDKRMAALLDTRLVIKGESDELIKFFEDQLLPWEDQLKQDFWWTVFNGWGVEQIIYDPDRSCKVIGYQREQFWRFQPMPDLIHAKLVDTTLPGMMNKIMPYGKWVLTTNNGTASDPYGDPMAERLIQPWIFKCNGWDLWMDFAKRFANGFLHAKIGDKEQMDEMRRTLEKAGKSSVIVTDPNTEVNMIQASRDSAIYTSIEEKTVASIQRVILGETLSSTMEVRGSSGAAEVHNEVRLEKTRADIRMVERALNETITQIAAVCGITGDLPYAELVYDPGLNVELATRDTILGAQGIKFTKDYYINNYGLEETEFEIVEPQPQQSFFAPKGKKTFLSPEDVKEFLGAPSKHICGSMNLDPNIARKNSRQLSEKEDTVDYLWRNGEPPINFDDLIAAINMSENAKDLDKNLTKLFDNRNNSFEDTLTDGLYYAATKGALLGNPEKLPSEEK